MKRVEELREMCLWRDSICEIYKFKDGDDEWVYVFHRREPAFIKKNGRIIKDTLSYYSMSIVREYFPDILTGERGEENVEEEHREGKESRKGNRKSTE